MPLSELAARVVERDRAGISRAISLVEDRRSASEPRIIDFLRRLHALKAKPCQRIGITGPPGVGKSTLVAQLALELRSQNRSVGILAVDPSSSRSGGALLGDRARISIDPDDSGVFIRSMASAGELGGLARAAGAACSVLSRAFDVVIVETIGVGQTETDIEYIVDTVCFVAQPASGDVLQFLKAGILEIPDILVVNKMDLGTVARKAKADLRAALAVASAAGGEGGRAPSIVATSAAKGSGIDHLVSAADACFMALVRDQELESRRARGDAAWTLRWFERRHGEVAVESFGGGRALERRIRDRIDGGELPLSIARALGEEYAQRLASLSSPLGDVSSSNRR